MKYILISIGLILPLFGNTQMQYEWVNRSGWIQGEHNITVDHHNNSYVTGDYLNTQDFDPGPGVDYFTSNGSNDIFISKYDSIGNYVWTKTFGGTGGEHGFSITSDNQNNIYCTGQFGASVDFNPGGTQGQLVSNGNFDMFILKLNSNGSFIWVKNIGGSLAENPTSIVHKDNNLYYSGTFQSTVDFDPGIGTSNLTCSGSLDAFVSKLDDQGNFIWAEKVSGTNAEYLQDISVDDFDNVYAVGKFQGTPDFNPGTGMFQMTASGTWDGFILKLNSAGIFKWAKKFNCDTDCFATSVTADFDNNIIIGGFFDGNIDFNSTDPSHHFTNSPTTSDCFLLKLDSLSNIDWAKKLTGPENDQIFDIENDSLNNVFVTGNFGLTINLDPDISDFTLTNTYNVSNGSYISKFNENGDFQWALGQYGNNMSFGTGIDLNKNGSIYCLGRFSTYDLEYTDVTGTYHLTGEDSTSQRSFIAKINECYSSNSSIIVAQCGSYVSPSQNNVWNSSGFYVDTILNSRGCDSIINIDLTILDYGINSVDTIVCTDFVLPWGPVVNISGTYYDTVPNPPYCDSIIEINLTVNTIDPSVSIIGNTLQSLMNNASYQWLDCDSNMNAISGAVSQSFTPPVSGSYALEINHLGCIDTSACVPFNLLGTNFPDANSISIYPNPTNGSFSISGLNDSKNISLIIMDMEGGIVFEKTLSDTKNIQIHLGLSTGMYFVELHSPESVLRLKLMMQ